VKLRRLRRAAGPAAAHRSQYGPQRPPKITSDGRDAIYQQIRQQVRHSGDLTVLFEHGELGAAKRLAREVTDGLQLILDGLGWGETRSGGCVELNLPADQLRRTFSRLRERAVEQREASSQEADEDQSSYERSLMVIEICDQVLADVGDAGAGAE
jgi:hypothetical protein